MPALPELDGGEKNAGVYWSRRKGGGQNRSDGRNTEHDDDETEGCPFKRLRLM